jgi:hypothetical protein
MKYLLLAALVLLVGCGEVKGFGAADYAKARDPITAERMKKFLTTCDTNDGIEYLQMNAYMVPTDDGPYIRCKNGIGLIFRNMK